MKLSNGNFKLRERLSILLILFSITLVAQDQKDYASVLANADWGWQNRDGVYYGKASFADLYGNPQRISIARYSDQSMATMLYNKERSKQGTNALAAEAGATVAINSNEIIKMATAPPTINVIS